jgi:hypothetical protein
LSGSNLRDVLKVSITKKRKVEDDYPSTFQLYSQWRRLSPLALDGDSVDLDIEYDEAPKLVELEVHPELFGF